MAPTRVGLILGAIEQPSPPRMTPHVIERTIRVPNPWVLDDWQATRSQAFTNRDRPPFPRFAMTTPNPASSGTLCVGAKDDFVLDAGSWFQIHDEQQLLVTRGHPSKGIGNWTFCWNRPAVSCSDSRRLKKNHLISDRLKLLVRTRRTFCSRLVTDSTHPLIRTDWRIPGLTRFSTFESTCVDILAPAKQRSKERDFGFR